MYEELLGGLDMHENNRTVFGLPSRIVAKIFMFKLMYGAMEYGYAQDPDFSFISSSPKYWRKVIDNFYNKYTGFAKWHTDIVKEVTLTGKLRVPGTGREFTFKQYPNKWGGMDWPVTQIKNYPVQGSGADLMALARLQVAKDWKLQQMEGVLVSSVHDSIVADVPEHETKKACILMLNSFEKVPRVFEKAFGIPYDLPFKGECSYGMNMYDMQDFKITTS
jgi:DNA polymerase-1